jgi:hypothetical protein
MPCNSDYLEPDRHEIESRRVAQLICFINSHKDFKCFERGVSSWIINAAKEIYGNKARLNELVVMLCSICSGMSKKEQDAIIYDARNKDSRDLADWWEEHQKADAERIEMEKRTAQRKKIRQAALSKLTKAEKEALGFS